MTGTVTDPLTGTIRCRCGAEAEFRGWRILRSGELLFKCGQCGEVVHRVGVNAVVFSPDGAHRDATWPQPGPWQWLGLVKTSEGSWVPTALTATLADCWSAMDGSWLRGDRVCIPIRPTGETTAPPRQVSARRDVPPRDPNRPAADDGVSLEDPR